jgi:hydrogenase maturation protease
VLVARRLRELGFEALDQSALLDLWQAPDDVVIVDAVVSGSSPGTVRVWEGHDLPRAEACRSSTHGLGVADAIGLARALGRPPRRLRVFGIEGAHFALGDGVSPEVETAVEQVASQIARELGRA